MAGDLEGREALVTGAIDGTGRLTAERLARRGATVLVHGRSREKADAVVRQLRNEGGEAAGRGRRRGR